MQILYTKKNKSQTNKNKTNTEALCMIVRIKTNDLIWKLNEDFIYWYFIIILISLQTGTRVNDSVNAERFRESHQEESFLWWDNLI